MKVNQMRMVSQPHQTDVNVSDSGEFSRLISAAVVSEEFCALLLGNPTRAIEQGYGNETFDFSPDERAQIVSVRASSLPEFVMHVMKLDGESVSDMSNINSSREELLPAASQV